MSIQWLSSGEEKSHGQHNPSYYHRADCFAFRWGLVWPRSLVLGTLTYVGSVGVNFDCNDRLFIRLRSHRRLKLLSSLKRMDPFIRELIAALAITVGVVFLIGALLVPRRPSQSDTDTMPSMRDQARTLPPSYRAKKTRLPLIED